MKDAFVHGDDVEGDAEVTEARIAHEPGFRRLEEPPLLLAVDHLDGAAEPRSRLRLDLAEHEPSPATDDQVELVAGAPDVDAEDAIAA